MIFRDQQLDHGQLAQLAWTGAAVALGYAVQLANGAFTLDAMPMLEGALALAFLASVAPRLRVPSRADAIVTTALLAGIGFQCWHMLSTLPAVYLADTKSAGIDNFDRAIVLAVILSGIVAATKRWQTRVVAMSCAFGIHFAIGAWVIHDSPKPYIDTYFFQSEAVEALLSGRNPYRIHYANIYPNESYYGPGLFVNNLSRFGYPYPPLPLYFATLGRLFGGDFRYAQLFGMTAAGVLIAALGSFRTVGSLAALLFLFTPRGLFVLEQSWTEPYLVFLLAAVALCSRRSWAATPWVTGLLLVAKQYTFLIAPLVWLLPRPPSARSLWRFAGSAAVSGAVVTLPLVLLRPLPFLKSVALLQFRQPFRADALSFSAYGVALGGQPLPEWLVFVAAVVAILIALWRAPRTTAGFCAAVALTYLCFFVFAKQAFCNYYYFVIGALCCAIAGATERTERDYVVNTRTRTLNDTSSPELHPSVSRTGSPPP